MHKSPFLFILAAAALGYGCSIINKPDELKPLLGDEGTGGTGGSHTNSGGTGEGGGAGEGGAPSGGAGTGGTPAVAPTKGLIVLGGTDKTSGDGTLSVLDPADGSELKRETLAGGVRAAAIAYDGELGVDNWYIFTAKTFPAPPDLTANLQIRHFDDKTNKWTTLDTVTGVPAPLPGSVAVLNGRLAYVSYVIIDGSPVQAVTVLDTSDPMAVDLVNFTSPHPAAGSDEKFLGLLGVRGTDEDPSLPGGTLNLVIQKNCSPVSGACELVVEVINVGSLTTTGASTTMGTYLGTAAFASNQLKRDTLFALPPVATGDNVSIMRVDDARTPDDNNPDSTPVSATDLSAMAVAECNDLVGFSLTSGTANVFSIAGVKKSIPLNHPGQLLAFEPFSNSLISTFNSNGDPAFPDPQITAFTVGSNATGTSVTFSERPATDFTAPADLNVDAMAVRAPIPVECPQ